MSYFQGYTQEEIARELEMPVGTVKTKIRSAIIELRKIFN
jgi:DNA-directed RNA polymerase specialized sigma24 family protein